MTTPADQPTGPAPRPADPFELWRQIYDANERAWSTALEKAMATPAFAQTQGKVLETFLQAQKAVRDTMRSYLESVNLPTREDIARLGELIVGLEEKIDQLSDRFDQVESAAAAGATSRTAPPKAPSRPGRAADSGPATEA